MTMNDMRQMTTLGREIEESSFATIDREVRCTREDLREWEVVRRVIHASADFEYAELMRFSADAIDRAMAVFGRSSALICDVEMIVAGLSVQRLAALGLKTYCSISDPEVIERAKLRNSTRAIEAMHAMADRNLLGGSIVAIGNAPTALLELLRLAQSEQHRPAFVVGVPVGFVSAAESKAALADSDLPFITCLGRKGGSTIAVSILHALFRIAAG
jgi:precorrin-8X/cobalt-precorrin-8 methylmutase